MTWNSGACDVPLSGGTAWISTDAYAEPVRVTDAEVRADDAEFTGDLTARSSSE